jgi:hypothetical protein
VYAGENEGLSRVPESAVLTGGQWSIHDGVGERTGVPSAIAGYSSTAPFGIMERVTAYISDLVRAKAWFSLLSRLWQEMGDKETRAEVGYAFERYCYDVLCAPHANGTLTTEAISSPVARLFFMVPSQYCSTFRLPANSRPYPEEVELYVMRVSPPVEHVVRTLPSDFLDSFAQWQNARAMARTEQAAPPAVPPNASEKERAKKRVKK